MIGLFDSLVALREAAHVLAIRTVAHGSVIKWVTIDETDDYAGAVYHEGVVNPGVEAFVEIYGPIMHLAAQGLPFTNENIRFFEQDVAWFGNDDIVNHDFFKLAAVFLRPPSSGDSDGCRGVAEA